MKFKAGDKVRCIDDAAVGTSGLVAGRTYIIEDYVPGKSNRVYVKEILGGLLYFGRHDFFEHRFTLVEQHGGLTNLRFKVGDRVRIISANGAEAKAVSEIGTVINLGSQDYAIQLSFGIRFFYDRHLEPVDNVNIFSVGDKVVRTGDSLSPIVKGNVYTVDKIRYDKDEHLIIVKEFPQDGFWSTKNFTLVTEEKKDMDSNIVTENKEEPLDSLIEVANKGIIALHKLRNNYPGKVQRVYNGRKPTDHAVAVLSMIRVEKKPTSFTVANYKVTIGDGLVEIGCKQFYQVALMESLNYLLNKHGVPGNVMSGMVASRQGISYAGNFMIWVDVDTLYKKLKELL